MANRGMISGMRIFMTGATGFIGKALAARLASRGDQVVAWVRDADRAKRVLDGAELLPIDRDPVDALGDAVINLAGEPVLGRWTEAKKQSLWASRVALTERLVDAIGRANAKPKVLISASAVGYYGDRKDERLTESSPPGSDFLANLCVDWERAARRAENHGLRVALIRIGVVLGKGGALEKMLPAFKAGAGGKIGSGEQYMPWIHLEDLVSLFVKAIDDPSYSGPINGTAPNPVKNKEFTRVLTEVLHRPAIVSVPSFVLKLMFGEGSSIMTEGQRAVPERATELGFAHRFSDLREALRDVLR